MKIPHPKAGGLNRIYRWNSDLLRWEMWLTGWVPLPDPAKRNIHLDSIWKVRYRDTWAEPSGMDLGEDPVNWTRARE